MQCRPQAVRSAIFSRAMNVNLKIMNLSM